MALPFYRLISHRLRKILVTAISLVALLSFINQSKRFYHNDVTSQSRDAGAALNHRLLWLQGDEVTRGPGDLLGSNSRGMSPLGENHIERDVRLRGRIVLLKGGVTAIVLGAGMEHSPEESQDKNLAEQIPPAIRTRNSLREFLGGRDLNGENLVGEKMSGGNLGGKSPISPTTFMSKIIDSKNPSGNMTGEEGESGSNAASTPPTTRVRRTTPFPPTGIPLKFTPTLHQPSELCSRELIKDSDGPPPHDGLWFNFTLPGFRLFTYSAFYDNRPSLLSDPIVRIISMSTDYDKFVNATNITSPFVYCGLHYDNETVYVAAEVGPKPIGRSWGLFGEPLKEYIYSCPTKSNRTNGAIPYAVSIMSKPADESVTACVPIEVPRKPKVRKNLGICVQAAYEDGLDPYALIEWFEFQSMLGVDHVGVYNLSLNSKYDPILNHYINTGMLSVRNASHLQPRAWATSNREYMVHGSPAINDCFYRNMHNFNYIAVIDFDEVILPTNYSNLPDLLRFLDQNYSTRKHPPMNYVFYNHYYFLDLPPDLDQSPYLMFSRYRRRVARSPYGYAVKSIINPRACLQVHNHYCWGATPGYWKNAAPEVIYPGFAVNQHYKKCHFDEKECSQMLSNNVTLDENILRYSSELRQRTQAKVFTIFGRNI